MSATKKDKTKRRIETLTDAVIKVLAREGVTIQRYDSYSTNSVYLKFDFGMSNSLRISDHKGKNNLKYMFNLDSKHKAKKRRVEKEERSTRYYYGFNNEHFVQVIEHILEHRNKKIQNAGGLEQYQIQMKKSKEANQNKKGFWKESKIVT